MKQHLSILLWAVSVLSGNFRPATACTIFCDSQAGVALAGNNEDYIYAFDSRMWFVPALPGAHGRVCFGWNSRAQGGMNDQGLFMDGASLGDLTDFNKPQPGKPVMEGNLIERVLANCSTVEEAITFLDKYAYQGNPAHSLIADRFGNSVVCEWYDGQFRPLRKKGRYQLITNFPLLNPQLGGFPCVRNIAASKILEAETAPSVAESTAALKAAAADYGTSGTTYSQVYDLANGEVYLYYRKHFEKPLKFNLAAELAKGLRSVDLAELYEKGTGLLAVPEHLAAQPIVAAELWQRVLAARGPSESVTNIHSFRAAGTITVTNTGHIETGSMEILAAGAKQFRITADLRPGGHYQQSFDGQTAWKITPNAAKPHVMKNLRLTQFRNSVEFVNWFNSGALPSATGNVVAAWFEGRECYEVKSVGQSGQEITRYYDAATCRLAGVTSVLPTQSGPSWSEMTFSDYRHLNGYLFPTHWSFRTEADEYDLEFRELQVNGIADTAFVMPKESEPSAKTAKAPAPKKPEHTAIHLNPAVFDAYVGYYKVAPGKYFNIDRDGDRFTARFSGQNPAEIFPESETNFFYRVIDAQITFVEKDRQVTGFILHEGVDQWAAKVQGLPNNSPFDAYAGQYQFGADSGATNLLKPGTVLTIGRRDGQLTAQVGQSSGELVPESETNFFGRMSGTEYTFVRDGHGKVTQLIFRKEPIEARATRISDQTPIMDPRLLSMYVGQYEFTPDLTINVVCDDNQLTAQLPGSSTAIFPASETNFFSRAINAQYTFVKNARGEVISLILHEGGLNPEARKVK